MNNKNFDKENEHLMPTYNRFPIIIDHGDGVYLYDNEGNKYLDFVAGIAVNSLGYNDKGFIETLNNQAKKLQHISNLYYHDPVIKAAEKLAELTGLDEVFFVNSGAEANECALKLARRYQVLNKNKNATKIISMHGSFHGRTIATVTITGTPKYHENFGPMLPDVEYAEFNNINSLKEILGDGKDVAAIILEPIKGEGGIYPAEKEYLEKVQRLCEETNTLLIFDEVQCGAARAGKFLASQLYGIKPDILTLAKGIGSGFPVGACLAKKEIGDVLTAGTHGTTYGGNPLACSIVNYVVSTLSNKEFQENINKNGKYFKEQLLKLQEKYPNLIKEVRGTGLILGTELSIPVAEVIDKALEKGLLLLSAANNTIRFVPPLIINQEEIDQGIEIIDSILKEY